MNRSCYLAIGLALGLTLLVPCPASAIELTIPDLYGSPMDEIQAPVTVRDFNAVAGLELHIQYNSTMLTADSARSAVLSGATINDILIPGEVHIIWEDFENPVTLPDDAVLAVLYFKVDEDASGLAAIEFFGNNEIVDEVADVLDLVLHSGGISISPTDANDDAGPLPTQFELIQNYPNPFNPATTISYSVGKTTDIVFEVFNITGQMVDRSYLGRKAPGTYSFRYHAGNMSSGVYTYRLSGNGVSQSREMVLIK